MSWPKPQTSSSISGHSFIPPWTREDSELSFIPPENSAARAFMKGRFERMPPQPLGFAQEDVLVLMDMRSDWISAVTQIGDNYVQNRIWNQSG